MKKILLIASLFAGMFIPLNINAENPDGGKTDDFLINSRKQVIEMESSFNTLHRDVLESGLSDRDKTILENIEKQNVQINEQITAHSVQSQKNQKELSELKEELFRISKLSFGLLVSKFWVFPFVLLLLIIAIAPLKLPHWWESNLNKAIVSLILSLPVIVMLIHSDYRHLLHSGKEYFSFIILIGSLFVISGGIYLHGRIIISPLRNIFFLMFGAVLANFIGTTGTAMVLFRPFIKANKHRTHKIHLVIFFIFIICNCGGLLTPLGDPPLFLGFLRGVPFQWTLRLLPQWLLINSVLMVVFYILDHILSKKESQVQTLENEAEGSLSFHGKMNFLFLAGVVASAFFSGYYALPFGVQEAGMIVMTLLSLLYSPSSSEERRGNGFTFGPFIEVAVLFAGIFATMIPCLILLETWGQNLNLCSPAQFFWASGVLSSFLDNAPTYLTFSAIASSLAGTDANHLGMLAMHPEGIKNLAALSCGAVFMGANTYIGNAPNFMVKALAEENGIRMPSFFGYMGWSLCILFPIFFFCTIIFFMN